MRKDGRELASMTRIYRRIRRRLEYGRHLRESVNTHMDMGYNVSRATYEEYRKKAREQAAAHWPTGPRSAPVTTGPAGPDPNDETRFDLIRHHPYLP